MKTNQLTRGEGRRVMYVENKDGDIDGADPNLLYDGQLPAVELARRSGDPEIVRLIEARLTRR